MRFSRAENQNNIDFCMHVVLHFTILNSMMCKGGRLLFQFSTAVDFGLKRPFKNGANWPVAVFETNVLGK